MPDALLTVVVAALGLVGGWLAKRTPAAGERENAVIDQLQELIAQQREINKEQMAALAAAQARERNLLDYVAVLRAHIDGRLDPPAPPWPEGLA